MLNWDEYNKEEAQAAPAIKSAIPEEVKQAQPIVCLLYTSPSPRDGLLSRMPSSA